MPVLQPATPPGDRADGKCLNGEDLGRLTCGSVPMETQDPDIPHLDPEGKTETSEHDHRPNLVSAEARSSSRSPRLAHSVNHSSLSLNRVGSESSKSCRSWSPARLQQGPLSDGAVTPPGMGPPLASSSPTSDTSPVNGSFPDPFTSSPPLSGLKALENFTKGLSSMKHLVERYTGEKSQVEADQRHSLFTTPKYKYSSAAMGDLRHGSSHRNSRDTSRSPHRDIRAGSRSKPLLDKYSELLYSPSSNSRKEQDYEPLKAVQDMVKAAERNSPPTVNNSFTRHDLFKLNQFSPMGKDSILRSGHYKSDQAETSTSSSRSLSQSANIPLGGSLMNYYLPPSLPQKREDTPDPDEPLDLSTKVKKESEEPPTKRSRRNSLSPADTFLSASDTGASSLKNLEKKFGEHSSVLDKIGSRHFNTPIRQFYMSAFGLGIYSAALNNSYPNYMSHAAIPGTSTSSTYCQPLLSNSTARQGPRFSVSESKPSNTPPVKKPPASSNPVSQPSESMAKSSYQPSKFLEQVSKEVSLGAGSMSSKQSLDNKKHTNLACSCGKDFDTLYELTLHLQETGHPASKTKNATTAEYPKLVRGQDMWLNQGSEQTKQILRCMQCGESFKSLPELTVHMINTKHYTNIVGSEATPSKLKPHHKMSLSMSDSSDDEDGGFKCFECPEHFDDVSALQHHREKCHMPRFPPRLLPSPSNHGNLSPESSSPKHARSPKPRSPHIHFKRRLLESLSTESPDDEEMPRERKPSISKLEDEEADSRDSSLPSPGRGVHGEGHGRMHGDMSKIRCENCSEKILTGGFVEHVRQCVKAHPKDDRLLSRDSYKTGEQQSESIREAGRLREAGRPPSQGPQEKKYQHADEKFHGEDLSSGSRMKFESMEQRRDSLSHRDQKSDSSAKSPPSTKDWYQNYLNCELRVKREVEDLARSHRRDIRSESKSEADSSTRSVYEMDRTPIPESRELVKPLSRGKEGSALKAMESFIEKSFTPGTPSHKPPSNAGLFHSQLFTRNFFSSLPQSFLADEAVANRRTRAQDRTSTVLPPDGTKNREPSSETARNSVHISSNHLYNDKYLPPLYSIPSPSKHSPSKSQPSPYETVKNDRKLDSPRNLTHEKPSPRPEDAQPYRTWKEDRVVNGQVKLEDRNGKEADDADGDRASVSSLPLELTKKSESQPRMESPAEKDKYLVGGEEKGKQQDRSGSKDPEEKGSALESLQGLVYGKNFNTEHPLDSLQKLIHTPHSRSSPHPVSPGSCSLPGLPRAVLGSGTNSNSTSAMQTTLPGTVILVNPIVTVMPNSTGGSPSVQITLPPDAVSPPLSRGDGKDSGSPRRSVSPTLSDQRSPSEPLDLDQPGDYRCQACNRHFASKGSYRYHQSRCHWSTLKKCRIKEAINTSPYVYLPLDHATKFNKYYEMANELANKGN